MSVARRSTAVSLVGQLVDLSATMLHLEHDLNAPEKGRLRRVADRIEAMSRNLGGPGEEVEISPDAPPDAANFPLLNQVERSAQVLTVSLSSTSGEAPISEAETIPAQPSRFVPDALTNPEHLVYALRGCLAATICYVIFNSVAWRGISTSLATCVITALASVGSSRQKQLLRISGAIVGGLFFGVGAQVLILPMLDTIAGFTVLFVAVSFVAAWFATSSPRLSYFGLQIALAFYLIKSPGVLSANEPGDCERSCDRHRAGARGNVAGLRHAGVEAGNAGDA